MAQQALHPAKHQRTPWRAPRADRPLPEAARRLLRLLQDRPGVMWSREALAQSLDMTDRAMRAAAEALRHHGHPVLSTTDDGGGYWLATTAAEIQQFRDRVLTSRIITLSEESRALLRAQRRLRTIEAQREAAPALQRALAIA